jgi:hypothetical protein
VDSPQRGRDRRHLRDLHFASRLVRFPAEVLHV